MTAQRVAAAAVVAAAGFLAAFGVGRLTSPDATTVTEPLSGGATPAVVATGATLTFPSLVKGEPIPALARTPPPAVSPPVGVAPPVNAKPPPAPTPPSPPPPQVTTFSPPTVTTFG